MSARCESCLRWPECNGVDADNCPLCQDPPLDADEHDVSGLLEE